MEETDEQVVRKMTEFIKQQKSMDFLSSFNEEFQDFVAFKTDCAEEEDDEDEDDEITTSVATTTTALTLEEHDIIGHCSDPDLKQLLTLNRTRNMQLIKLHSMVRGLIKQCHDVKEEKLQMLTKLGNTKQVLTYSSGKLAAPYFKDHQFYSCPKNEDVIKRRQQNELSMYDILPDQKWSIIEFNRLIAAVKCNYNVIRQNDIFAKLKQHPEEKPRLEQELQYCKDNRDIAPPLGSNEFIDWDKVSELFLKDKRLPSECQNVWNILVHPDINKSDWSQSENERLEEIVQKHACQNWDAIAEELGTRRTAFITCLHYHSQLSDRFRRHKFTVEEDNALMEVVTALKTGDTVPWSKVVRHFDHRSRHQLYHRYTYFLSQGDVKRGKFSEAEDILLMILVNRFGKNFKKCSFYMPNRSQVQLKSRYNSNLQQQIKKGAFSPQDDQVIMRHIEKYGNKTFAPLTKVLGRCRGQIRQRYRLIKQFLTENPGCNVGDMPQKRFRFRSTADQFNFICYMADQYKGVDFIPTLQMIEDSLQMEEASSKGVSTTGMKNQVGVQTVEVKNIDHLLVDFFTSSTSMNQRANKDVMESNICIAGADIRAVLKELRASIEIPDDFELNPKLDETDLQILSHLSDYNMENADNEPINRLVPPNIGNVVGLRGLIIKHNLNKKTPPVESEIGKIEEDVLQHRQLFDRRFQSLFYWAAVLSVQKAGMMIQKAALPTSSIATTDGEVGNATSSDNSDEATTKRRRLKVKSLADLGLPTVDESVFEEDGNDSGSDNSDKPATKRRRLKVKSLADLGLPTVDKSVVDHLMKNSKHKIVKFDMLSSNNMGKVLKSEVVKDLAGRIKREPHTF